jgi:hypothetical protein
MENGCADHPSARRRYGCPLDGMVECVYGEHTKRDIEHEVEAGNQEALGETGQGFGTQLQLSDLGCRRSLCCRSGKNAGGNAARGSAGKVRALRQARGHESLAAFLGHRAGIAAAEMRLRERSR